MLIFFKGGLNSKYPIDLEAYLEICYHLIQNVYVYKTKIRHLVKIGTVFIANVYACVRHQTYCMFWCTYITIALQSRAYIGLEF